MSITHLDKLSPLTELTLESVNQLVRAINTRFEKVAPSLASQPVNHSLVIGATNGIAANFPIGRGTWFRISAPSAVTLTGIAGGFDGRIIVLENLSQVTITLAHQSTSSVAVNRFYLRGLADITLTSGNAIAFVYDGVLQYWLRLCAIP